MVAVVLILVAWLDVLTHEPSQNPTVSPNIYDLNQARIKLTMNPQPELGSSRVMVSPKAYLQFVNLALLDPKNNFLVKRLSYCANCNLLDAVPKVDGFFSLTTGENNNLFSLIYSTTNDFPHLDDFLGVSQLTAPDEIYNWQPRKTYLPLVTAGQKPVFLDDAGILHALTESNFDGSQVVFLPPETKGLLMATNQTEAHVLNSKVENQSVSVDVEAATPALVVVSQSFYHDWYATVDNQPTPLLRANYGFQAVQVPQGRHSIELTYKDREFDIGAILSGIGWLICLLRSLWQRRVIS